MVVAGPGGRRSVAAAEFFRDYLQTAIAPDEVLVEIRVPKLGDGWGYHYEKFHRTAQAWALVGVAALVRRSNGSIAEARVGLTNMGPHPVARDRDRGRAGRGGRDRRGDARQRPSTPPTAPTRRPTCTRRPTTGSTSPGCSPRRAVSAAAGV